MAKKKMIQKAATPVLTAACIFLQIGTACGGVAGSATAIENGNLYTQGSWKYENENWKHYEASGTPSTGWIQKASGWYHLRPEDGTMMTGWIQYKNGTWYYLNTQNDGTEGQMRSGWYMDDNGAWYFFNTSNDGTLGAMKTGWQWIDGHCYYFNTDDTTGKGTMYTGQTTPDGFYVNKDGCWAEIGGDVHYEAGKGLSSTPPGKNTTKTAFSGGGSGSSGGRGSSGSNSGSNGGNHNGGGNTPKDEAVFVNKEKTKLVDLGWIRYAVITFQEGNMNDYTIDVDGIDITDNCTNVDDRGTVVKSQTTFWKANTMTVTRIADGKKQRVNVGNGSVAKASLEGNSNPASAPSAILTNGPVSIFDYWLDNYDKDGNVRIRPEKTTFSLNGKSGEAAPEIPTDYYAPDTMIDKEGNGKIHVKLSLKTEAQEKWFSQLKVIKALDTENNILNKNLTFTTSVETQYGKTGVITIRLPQSNLFSCGRYQLNLSSEYGRGTMNVPLHLVDNRTYKMNLNALNTSPKPGEDFAFDIVGTDGESFGTEILSPIYRVDLTMPSGKVKSLTKIEEWYEIGPMLHICGTNPDGNVITDENGVYTVTAYANGYQTMTKKVEVGSNSPVAISTHGMLESYSIDAMSSATVSIPDSNGSGGSGSSGGSKINAFLIFDHDLLANALILHEINYVSEDSEAVVQWWYDQKAQAVIDENAETFYDFKHYLNAVKDAKLGTGEYLTFEKYKETQTGGETTNRPYQIKRILEDGRLGTVESLSTMVGKTAPPLKGTEGKLGENLNLTSGKDAEYISNITALYLDGGAIPLRNDDYSSAYRISEAKDSITILSKTEGTAGGTLQLTPGTHKLRIVSKGYKEQTVSLNVVKELETVELSLAENPNKIASEGATVYHMGQMVSINAAANADDEKQNTLRGDFLKNITGMTLTDPEDKIRAVLSDKQGGMFSEDNYKKDNYSFVLQKNLFKKAGQYTVTVTAEGYKAKTLTFEILAATDNPGEGKKSAPAVIATEYVKETNWEPAYYRIIFDVSDEKATNEYLDAEKTIKVNGVSYDKTAAFYSTSQNKYKVSKDYSNSVVKWLDVTANGFPADENEVVIQANGYEPLSFTIPANVVKLEQFALSLADNPNKTNSEEATAYHVGQMVSIHAAADATDDIQKGLRGDFMKNLTGMTLSNPEGTTRTVSSYEQGEMSSQDNYKKNDYSFTLQKNLFKKAGEYTVTVTAKGYRAKTLTFEILAATEIPTEGKKSVPEATATEYVKATTWVPAYYRVTFDVTDQKATKSYLDAVKTITVNGTTYNKAVALSNSSQNKYKVSKDPAYAVVKWLDFTANGFTKEENEVLIEADGYEDLTLTILLDESGAGIDNLVERGKNTLVYDDTAKTEVETADNKAKEAEKETAEGTSEGTTEETTEETAEEKAEKSEEYITDIKPEEPEKKAAEEKTGESKKQTADSEQEEMEKVAVKEKAKEVEEQTTETRENSINSQEELPEEVAIEKMDDKSVEE